MYPRTMNKTTCDKFCRHFHKPFSPKKDVILRGTFSNFNKRVSPHKYSPFLYVTYYIILLIYFPLCCDGFCPSKCVCNDESLIVQCTNASLDVIPYLMNPRTQFLSLPCNKIEDVGQSLNVYPDLRKIDLSYNHIKNIDAQDFEAQKNLQTLNLNKNRLKLIQNKSLVTLISLRELYISNNILTLIESNSFDNSVDLRVLDLSNNKLKSLNEDTFSESNKLEVLKLSYNYFTEVPSNAIYKIENLKELDLTGNLISAVPKSAFHTLLNLSSISLDKNNISAIYQDSFQGLSELKSLSMKDNRLSTVAGNFFRPLVKLQVLDLSGNLFQELDRTAFPHLSSLLHLSLTRCPRLYRIDSEAFVNLESLETLRLSHNARLVHLGDSIFSSLDRLTDLDLTACGLVHVHPNQMPRGQATTLHLAGNPLHCNCSLLWLASLPFNDSFYLDAPTCATPANLYGVPVNKVDLRAAGCDPHLGLAAIGTCVGVVLLGLLVIGVFLAWKWRKRTLSTSKTLPGGNERGLGETWGAGLPPPGPLAFPGAPIYLPRYCLPPQVSVSSCGHHQCQEVCHALTKLPYSLPPATRPLLTPPPPSLPVDGLYPSPYDDDTHWYTTIGRDGREYLTGELKRDFPTAPPPPPLPRESPPLHLTPQPESPPLPQQEEPSLSLPHLILPPSSPSPASSRVKRSNSCKSPRTPTLPSRPPPVFVMQEGVAAPLSRDGSLRIPVTYI